MRLRWIFILMGGALTILIMGTLLFFEAQKVIAFARMMNQKTQELEQKTENTAQLRDKIEFYKTDEGIAYLGRELHNFSFPNEKIFLFQISGDKK